MDVLVHKSYNGFFPCVIVVILGLLVDWAWGRHSISGDMERGKEPDAFDKDAVYFF